MESNSNLWYKYSLKGLIYIIFICFLSKHVLIWTISGIYSFQKIFSVLLIPPFFLEREYTEHLRLVTYIIFVYTDNNFFFIYQFAYSAVYNGNIVHCLTSERKNNNKAKLSFYLKSIRPYNSQYLQFTGSIFIHLLSTLRGRNNDRLQALYFKIHSQGYWQAFSTECLWCLTLMSCLHEKCTYFYINDSGV